MCGIVGIQYADASRPVSEHSVARMRDLVSYRGPDDFGVMVDGSVGLGHRRLSIIDISGGHQPMFDRRSASTIVFNGEIYNFRELRDELIRKGFEFQTSSDTEVILQLYAERGERCVEALNGMFAFAIWDSARRRIFLARDRLGVKPLYYVETPQGLAFASEIKSLFVSGLVGAELRSEAVAEYMVFRQVAGPDTLFRNVKALPPGCTMTVVDGRATTARYWSPRPQGEHLDVDYEEARELLASLLEDAVRLRLISEVPVGTFCSGGVDSSLVTALAVKQRGGVVNTYSVGFDEPDFDESAEAVRVSAHCGTQHHTLKVGNGEFGDLLPRMVWHNDEPLDFANSIQIYALSRLAKQSVTVVLTGEGSDELFGGYPRYRIPSMARYAAMVPRWLREPLVKAVGDRRLAKLSRYADGSIDDALMLNASYNTPEAIAALCPDARAFDFEFRRGCLLAGDRSGADLTSRVSLLDQETFLVGILNRQDKMSMAAGIESRVPFMDYRIVELANRLPSRIKSRRGQGKALVKDVARRVLPAEIVDRRKSGFGVPLAAWFRATEGLGPLLMSLPDSAKADLFDRSALTAAIGEHRAGRADHSELLWTALNLVTWREAFSC